MTCLTPFVGAALLLVPVAIGAEYLTGKVVGITDGDTITVLVAHRPGNVRLAEIERSRGDASWDDAPRGEEGGG